MRNWNFFNGGTLPYARFLKIFPSDTGLLKYSPCCAFVLILDNVLSICSSVFFAGHVLFPFLSRIFTTSQLFASLPARVIQQSLAMILPHHITSVGSEIERVGYKAFSTQSHFLLSVTGFLQSSSVS